MRQGSSSPEKARNEPEYPVYCDYSCPHADFTDPCAVGACRRDVGVWCARAGKFNNKHARCLFRARETSSGR